MNKWLGLVVWLGLVFAAAAVGGLASASAGDFYSELVRPSWGPPAWLFGPVWSILYTLMGISAWLVWRESGFTGARTALALFILQLVANALWTWIFFAWRLGALGFVEIVLLWVLILLTIINFKKVSRVAAVLLIPYLVWVTFAAILTYTTWQLNPDLLG